MKAITLLQPKRITFGNGCAQSCVGDIQEHLGVKQSVTSTQLALLRDRGVLAARRNGVQVYYSVANPAVLQVLDCIRRHRSRFVR